MKHTAEEKTSRPGSLLKGDKITIPVSSTLKVSVTNDPGSILPTNAQSSNVFANIFKQPDKSNNIFSYKDQPPAQGLFSSSALSAEQQATTQQLFGSLFAA